MNWVKTKVIDNNFYYDFKKTKNIEVDPLTASLKTIDYITKTYTPPYTLMLSGGVDSQAMLYAWHLSKVPYTTLSAVYNYNLNDHDLVTLRDFSSNFNIHVNYKNFDLFNFLETEYLEYSNRYLCGSPHMCTYMKLADIIENGTVIMSGNFIQENTVVMTANTAGLINYKNLSGKSIIPFFFLETEELAWAFNDFTLEDINNDKNLYRRKVRTYQHFGFPVIKQNTKYTGFEKVKEWYDQNYNKPVPTDNKLIRLTGQGSNRIFDLLYRNKYEVKFSKYKYYVIC